MKDAKKTKQVLFLETEKRHADLKIKLKHYGLSQSEFIRGCISGLISDDEQFLPFFFKLLEEKSYLKSAKNRKKNKACIRKPFITNVSMAKPPTNEYFTPIKKRTSIGRSPRSRPKNKNKRRQYVKYRGQG